MEFPVYFHLFGLRIHPHPVMEGLGYVVALTATFGARKRRREFEQPRALDHALWLTAGAAVGAVVGAKVLGWIENPDPSNPMAPHTFDNLVTGGKTIVGGLSGAWLGTEMVKTILGMRQRTGDPWVIPLCLSIAIGRIGCFLTGLSDNTYGIHTSVLWAVDFGDGPRHPTQLYESGFALCLFAIFMAIRRRVLPSGDRFRMFMLMYMLFRFFVEFLKPSPKPYGGLSAIQLVSLLTAAAAAWQLRNPREDLPTSSTHAV